MVVAPTYGRPESLQAIPTRRGDLLVNHTLTVHRAEPGPRQIAQRGLARSVLYGFREEHLPTMARGKKKNQPDEEAREQELLRAYHAHIRSLGFSTIEGYQAWCREHQLGSRRDKSRTVRWREYQLRKTQQEQHHLKASRQGRDPASVLRAVCAGELQAEDVANADLRSAVLCIKRRSEDAELMTALADMVALAGSRTRLLDGMATWEGVRIPFVEGLIHLCQRRGQWLRPLEGWRPRSKNRDRQFGELLRHLLANYDIPRFMDSAWLTDNPGAHHFRDWFVIMGRGESLRGAWTPIPFTRKMWHHFLEAPETYTVPQAIRYGQIHALGGRRPLADAIIATLAASDFDHHEFWESVLRFFIANPMLDRAHVGPIVDWLHHQRFAFQEVVTARGVETLPPPRPNLSMHGRTPETVLRDVDAWHHQLGKSTTSGRASWKTTGIPPLDMKTGSGETAARWRIRELLSTDELVVEGRAMGHCVASYAASCIRGHCSIWSMTVERETGLKRLQTIEVNAHKVIVQSRGRHNVEPTAQELKLLVRWADAAGLDLATYL